MEEFKVLGVLTVTAEVVQGIDGKHLAPTKSDCKNAITSSAGIRNIFPSLLLSISCLKTLYDWKSILQ